MFKCVYCTLLKLSPSYYVCISNRYNFAFTIDICEHNPKI